MLFSHGRADCWDTQALLLNTVFVQLWSDATAFFHGRIFLCHWISATIPQRDLFCPCSLLTLIYISFKLVHSGRLGSFDLIHCITIYTFRSVSKFFVAGSRFGRENGVSTNTSIVIASFTLLVSEIGFFFLFGSFAIYG